MSEAERQRLGITALPTTMGEAIAALEEDVFIRRVLGDDFIRRYLDAKKAEWKEYMPQVTEWEVEKYLYRI